MGGSPTQQVNGSKAYKVFLKYHWFAIYSTLAIC